MDNKLQKLFEQNGAYLKRSQLSGGMYSHLLEMVSKGIVKRVKRGQYYYRQEEPTLEMIDVDQIVPGGVLCMYSAWSYYKLSALYPQTFHISVEKSRQFTLEGYPIITLYQWRREYQKFGIVDCQINGYKLKIYDLEKSVCDALKYRKLIGEQLMVEILKNYVKLKRRNLPLLLLYAKRMRLERILRTHLQLKL